MNEFKGTWQLTRLAFRRDRIKLPVWVIGIVGIMLASVAALGETYSTYEDKVAYAITVASSVATKVFGGSIEGPTLGAIMMAETYLFLAVLIAFMCTLSVVRHTRQNEETGRSELIRSTATGRYSEIAAALLITTAANTLTSFLIYLTLLTNKELSSEGSLGLALTFFLVGLSFTAIAAITAQISESARGANSLAAIAIGVAFLLRGVGDGLGTVAADGMYVTSNWLSWLSPLGWGQLVSPYVQQRWWILGVLATFSAFALIAAAYLIHQRDIGMGIVPARKGPVHASPRLASPLGLALRLQKNIIISWSVCALCLGAIYGSLADEFSKMLSQNETLATILGSAGSTASLSNVLLASMFNITAIFIVGYAIQSLLRSASEETTGHLESVLSSKVSKYAWLGSHILPVIVGTTLLLIITGLSTAITYRFVAPDVGVDQMISISLAPLSYLSAVLVIYGFGVLLFGLIPRFMTAAVWGGFIVCVVIGQFAGLLKLPHWLVMISPFSHVALTPSEAVQFMPIVWLSLVASIFMTVGLIGFRRRDSGR